MHPAHLPLEELLAGCVVRTARGSGPGGQHRNKTDSAVAITHTASGVVGQGGERRSQGQNRAVAIERLRLNLAVQVRGDRSRKEQVWQRWVRGGRVTIAASHADYPSLLADAIDCLDSHRYELAAAAAELNIASSQILKLLRGYPPALEYCNARRGELGLHPWR